MQSLTLLLFVIFCHCNAYSFSGINMYAKGTSCGGSPYTAGWGPNNYCILNADNPQTWSCESGKFVNTTCTGGDNCGSAPCTSESYDNVCDTNTDTFDTIRVCADAVPVVPKAVYVENYDGNSCTGTPFVTMYYPNVCAGGGNSYTRLECVDNSWNFYGCTDSSCTDCTLSSQPANGQCVLSGGYASKTYCGKESNASVNILAWTTIVALCLMLFL